MLKKVCRKKIVVLFLCSWVAFVSNSAIAIPPRWCMDCASFGASIAKIFDTISRVLGFGGGNGNQRQQEEVQQEEIIIETIEENRTTTRRPNGTITQNYRCKHCAFIYSKLQQY